MPNNIIIIDIEMVSIKSYFSKQNVQVYFKFLTNVGHKPLYNLSYQI